jgi:hypothetical protein
MTMAALSEPAQGPRTVALPDPRGPWTESLYALLDQPTSNTVPIMPALRSDAVLHDDDLQMALYLCYELHYAELTGVDERLEWSPVVLMLRASLEAAFEAALSAEVRAFDTGSVPVGQVLQQLVRDDDGPPLSRYLETRGTRWQFLEHIAHRSAYQLKEADPHSWAIPRLAGSAKTALMEIQADEYGGGDAERMHSALFANTMRGVGLDPGYGAYLPLLPGITLATVNLMSYFGLHRRLRGALAGHLALFEMTSSIPNRRYGNGLRRLGYGPAVTDFYDEHVEADAVHESIAAWDLGDGLARIEPRLAGDVVFGGRALLRLEALWAEYLLDSWERGETSLTAPLDERGGLPEPPGRRIGAAA